MMFSFQKATLRLKNPISYEIEKKNKERNTNLDKKTTKRVCYSIPRLKTSRISNYFYFSIFNLPQNSIFTNISSIFWFRFDLRIKSNKPLISLINSGTKFIALITIDPEDLRQNGNKRKKFLKQTLEEISENLSTLKIPTKIIFEGSIKTITNLCKQFYVKEIIYSINPFSSKGLNSEEKLVQSLNNLGLSVTTYFLNRPIDLESELFKPWRKINSKSKLIREKISSENSLQLVNFSSTKTIKDQNRNEKLNPLFPKEKTYRKPSFNYHGGELYGIKIVRLISKMSENFPEKEIPKLIRLIMPWLTYGCIDIEFMRVLFANASNSFSHYIKTYILLRLFTSKK
mmetsp:Transcript_24112/g.37864  ORF Transcript_24112/g.37864 Transcript_24112/m.37864 type:complete len:343 (+) Transcript_24112:46-1074(+)